MKYGIRKPSVKKSISARTSGKIKREIKKSVNPLYGKKGMGIINDPKKATYNAVYSKTTANVSDLLNQEVSEENHAADSFSIGNVFELIGLLFKFLFSLLRLGFWLALIIGIIALLIWIF